MTTRNPHRLSGSPPRARARALFAAAHRFAPLLALLGLLGVGCAADQPVSSGSIDTAYPFALTSLCSSDADDGVLRGASAFVDRNPQGLGGNGRSCADCHMPEAAFQLSPASVERRFLALQARRRYHPDADDPLFRPIDADDFRIHGAEASDYSNLRDNGLIRITFPLPPTLALVDRATGQPSRAAFVDLWRSVPTVNNVKLTGPDPAPPSWPCIEGDPAGPACTPRGPNPNGGYQLDARVTSLAEQALGAFTNHAQVATPPSAELLDDLASFQSSLFSSDGLRAVSAAIDDGVTPEPDPDPPLDELEEEGKRVFVRACATCHEDAAGTHPAPGLVRFHNIQSACPRPVDGPQLPGYAGEARFAFAPCRPALARNAQLYEITRPDGSKVRRESSDPGRTLLTGFFAGGGPRDDWQSLEVASTRGISQTAPYFHNNSAATLDEVLDHYQQLFKFIKTVSPAVSPTGVPLPLPPPLSTDGVHLDRPFTDDERPALLAYLRIL